MKKREADHCARNPLVLRGDHKFNAQDRKGKISLPTSCTHSIKDPPLIASKHRQGESGKKRDKVEKEFVSQKNEVSNHNVPLVDSENNRLSKANFQITSLNFEISE